MKQNVRSQGEYTLKKISVKFTVAKSEFKNLTIIIFIVKALLIIEIDNWRIVDFAKISENLNTSTVYIRFEISDLRPLFNLIWLICDKPYRIAGLLL